MPKIVLDDLTQLSGNEGAAITLINANFDAIETEWENNLSRDGEAPNEMESDLDMNANDILNVGDIQAENIIVNDTITTESIIAENGTIDVLRVDQIFVEGIEFDAEGAIRNIKLEQLSDVDVAGRQIGDTVEWDGTFWVMAPNGAGGGGTWGTITGTLSDQTDLQAALDAKAALVHTHTSAAITDFTEASQDVIGTSVISGTGITVSYDDPSGFTTVATTITQYTDEQARDAIGAALVEGAGIDITVDDGLDTITIASTVTQYSDELAQDAIAAAFAAGTQTGITISYNDAGNSFSFTNTVTQYTDEQAQDAVGAMLNSTLEYVDATPLLRRAAITGDISIPNSSNASTLATVNANVGTFGSATQVPQVTVNAKGLVTAVSNVTITGGVSDGDKGDITVSGSGTVWTIDPNVVTISKLQQVATNTLLGRDTSGTGNVEVITLNTTMALTGGQLQRSALVGDVEAALGSNTTTLATVNADIGTFGNATNVAQITVNEKGLTTGVVNVPIVATVSNGDKGDITVTSSGTVWTIDPDVVDFTKIQDIPTDTLIGRDTAGTGDPEIITVNNTLVFSTGELRRAALIGDVTALAGSNTTTIASSAVTNAKLANMADQTIKGNDSGVSAAPQDLTSAEVITLLQTGLDARYVQEAGDTMTGPLVVQDGSSSVAGLQIGTTGDKTHFYKQGNNVRLNFADTDVHRWNSNSYQILTANNAQANLTLAGGAASLTVVSAGAGAAVAMQRYQNVAGGASFTTRHSRAASSADPLVALNSGDGLWQVECQGDDGNVASFIGARMQMNTTQAWTSTQHGSQIVFATVSDTASATLVNTFSLDNTLGLRYQSNVILDTNRLFQLRSTTLAGALAGAAGKIAYFTDADDFPVYHDGTRYKKTGHSDGYQTVATNADFTLTPMTSQDIVRHTGTLTADRAVTLSTTNAYPGYTFRITRTGAGAFNLNIGTGPLKALVQNTWCEVVYDGSAWYLSEYGAL